MYRAARASPARAPGPQGTPTGPEERGSPAVSVWTMFSMQPDRTTSPLDPPGLFELLNLSVSSSCHRSLRSFSSSTTTNIACKVADSARLVPINSRVSISQFHRFFQFFVI
ncbi:hypothetical protein PGT21_016792 [Puccinia graminis f. sp. tritici]|uniref:Uncharacterized protein n=1 Tax=Puccinia graminis f. sp. tritici TaxID=56615 RepID=A0A5B0LUI5_PUCGR|nr:hypothetical protein PGT21_016792 [Puccinia graminis f. sp. tritici]KAA1093478.1 hypothetical protein PGTUg99_020876 [Puccinia graminis f. sp. tritici]